MPQAGADADISWSYKVGEGLDFQIWDLNRVHETERTIFPIQEFSACVDVDYDIKEKHNGYSTNSVMNTL